MREEVDQLYDYLVQLSTALSNVRTTEVNSITVKQKMLGSLEKIVVGDGSTVVINQNLILAADAHEMLQKSLLLLDRLKEVIPSRDLTLTESVDRYRNNIIIDTLEKVNGDQIKAAELLGVTRRQIRYRVEANEQRRITDSR